MTIIKSLYSLISWKYLVVCYFSLLACSYFYNSFTEVKNSKEFITKLNSENTQLPIVLFIPDKQNSSDLRSLDTFLSSNFNLFVLDYTELYKNEANDDRFKAVDNAQQLILKLEEMNTRDVHIVAQGFGAIIAARAISLSPDTFSSITFINSSGLQEFELLGGHTMNRAVYGAQTGFWWGIEYLIPHFGLLNSAHSNYHFNRANYETDRRELRGIMNKVDIPTFVEQKVNRKFETYGISKEIERLIPQSIFKEYDISEEGYEESQKAIKSFIESVELGEIEEPSAERIASSKLPFEYKNVIEAEGWMLIGLMALIVFSTFFSEDLACIGAGLMVARGLMGFWPAMLAGLFGILIGDTFIYLAGKWLGKSAVSRKPISWFINEQDLERSYHWFESKGPIIILACRFIPGTRFPTYFSAGVIGSSFLMFFSYFGLSSIIWTPLIVGLSVALGQQMMDYFMLFQEYALWALVGLIFSAYLIVKLVVPLFTYRGRRILKGKFLRNLKWQYWSTYVIYTPVVLGLSKLWFRYRSISLFTSANSSVEEGGLLGEFKSSTLEQIGEKSAVAPFTLLTPNYSMQENLSLCDSFFEAQSIDYPLVLKPDSDKQGKDVKIIKNRDSLAQELNSLSVNHILQKFIEGREYDIFYYRYPNEESGQIFSIAKKELFYLIGDGEQTVEELILKDERAICLADLHLEKFVHELYDVPEKGETVPLVELASHSKGALYLDGEVYQTPELTATIDSISKSVPGFYFGQFDVIVPSTELLKFGKEITIIGLDGVLSTSSSVFDPKYSFSFAVKNLYKQWTIAYKIGSLNADKGIKPIGVLSLIKRLIKRN